jgi:catechol 2,3-dioxygenase-like lactoylglutathione lyase family enzyme
MSSLDHMTLNVSDYARSKAFYEKALAPLGIKPIMDFGQACGFGRDGKPDFWIGTGPASFQTPDHLRVITTTHVAFAARNRAEVEAFYAARRGLDLLRIFLNQYTGGLVFPCHLTIAPDWRPKAA